MTIQKLFLSVLPVIFLQWGCAARERPQACTQAWNEWVETQLVSGDGMGHGPDIGSEEWQSVIEFKLGVRGKPEVPPRASDNWCEFIDQRM